MSQTGRQPVLGRLVALRAQLQPEAAAGPAASWTFSGFADEAGADLSAQIAALQAAGMKHIDLRNVGEHNITSLPVEAAKAAQAQLAAAGISVCMFGSPIGKMEVQDDLELDLAKLRHLGKLKPIFNAYKVRMFSYFNNKEPKLPEAAFAAAALERVAALKVEAKKQGLQLYHENEGGIFGERLANTRELLSQLRDGESFFGIFDFSNFNQA